MDHDAEAIRAAFAACNLEVADDGVRSCISICADFALTADELAAQWDAYSMNHQLDGAADADKLAGFRSKLAQQKAAKPKDNAIAAGAFASQKRRPTAKPPSGTPVIKRDLDALYTMKSPEPKSARSFASPPGANKVQRTNDLFSPSYASLNALQCTVVLVAEVLTHWMAWFVAACLALILQLTPVAAE